MRRFGAGALMLVGVIAVAALLRAPITAVPPALAEITADLQLSAAAAGATTSLPLVCFGVFAFLAPLLIARHGLERTALLLLLPLLLGVLLRSAAGAAAFFLGAVLLGVGIAVGNVLLPALIRARFAGQVAVVMGVYVSTLQLSGAAGSALTVPLQEALGWRWRGALAVWAVPAVLLLPLWLVIVRRPGGPASGRLPVGLGHVVGRRMPWAITLFLALQAGVFYALLTWIPAQLTAHGISAHAAGLALGAFSLLGLPGAFISPQFATGRHARAYIAGAYGLQALATLLLLVGPTAALIGTLICGLTQGAGFSIALTFIADQPDPHDVPAVSALAQGIGYLAAAAGPVALGLLHEASDGWLWPDALLAVTVLVLVALGGAIGSRLHRAHAFERITR